ncbi:MAG TPA: hypothetical protein VN323_18820 [Candidatus Dormibacteraeota bacterium]|jgi:hypothetical protein|nr:hypothetical protein [Candidatus Dormibacteraeota bacterium]
MVTATRSVLHTPLCERWGIRVPICQAGMALVARDLTDAMKGAIRRRSDP